MGSLMSEQGRDVDQYGNEGGLELISGERRRDRRYEIRLDMRWKLVRRRRVLDSGEGRTLDVSSGGISFETEKQLPLGAPVELSISWPVLLHNVAPLQLSVVGRVVRSHGGVTAIQMSQHEFRTLAASAGSGRAFAAVARSSQRAFHAAGIEGLGKIQ